MLGIQGTAKPADWANRKSTRLGSGNNLRFSVSRIKVHKGTFRMLGVRHTFESTNHVSGTTPSVCGRATFSASIHNQVVGYCPSSSISAWQDSSKCSPIPTPANRRTFASYLFNVLISFSSRNLDIDKSTCKARWQRKPQVPEIPLSRGSVAWNRI